MDYLRLRRLNRCQVAIIMIFCSLALAEESSRAKVTADRVNVRVRPDINSEIVTQLSTGEEVVVLEEKDEWAKIRAPSHSNCWVHSGCIEGVKIKTGSVNLRCGPGLAFPVLVKLDKGTPINIIEIFGEWTRIEPPVEFGVWVSSKYLAYEKPKEEIVEKPVVEMPTIEEKPPRLGKISVPEEEISGVELVSYAGRLEDLGIIINRPGTYKLLGEKDKWLCIIKSPTLDVNPYVNRFVRIEGVVISKSSSWGVPVIELKRLNVIK